MNEHHSTREDNEYVQKGTCSVFMFVEPLGGKRHVSVSRQRTRKEWAREVKPVVRERYPPADVVIELYKKRDSIRGLKWVYEMKQPRFLTGRTL
jgi:hypothetical protein